MFLADITDLKQQTFLKRERQAEVNLTSGCILDEFARVRVVQHERQKGQFDVLSRTWGLIKAHCKCI